MLQLRDLVRIKRSSRRFSLSRLSLDSHVIYALRDINTLKFICLTIYLKFIFVLLSSHIIYTLHDINNLKFICLTVYLKFIFVFISFLFSPNKLCQRGEYNAFFIQDIYKITKQRNIYSLMKVNV